MIYNCLKFRSKLFLRLIAIAMGRKKAEDVSFNEFVKELTIRF